MTRNQSNSLRIPDDWIVFVWYLTKEQFKRQYARTQLGPLWIVFTQFIMIVGIALVFFTIFHRPLDQFLLFISASILSWNLVSVSISNAPMAFLSHATLIRSFRLPFSIFPMQGLLNSLVVFLHGLVIHMILMACLGGSFATLLLLPLSLAVIAAILYPVIAVLGILGARFRDLGPLVGSIMYMAFLVTPIIWERVSISRSMVWVVDLNPLYYMIEVLRHPMLGTLPSTTAVVVTVALAATSLVGGELFFRRYSRPLPFWV